MIAIKLRKKVQLSGGFFCYADGVALGKADGGNEGEADDNRGDKEPILEGIVFGQRGGISFL